MQGVGSAGGAAMDRRRFGGRARPTASMCGVALTFLAGAIGGGCASPLPYEPDDTLVATEGGERVREKLARIVRRAVEPSVVTADAGEDALEYKWIGLVAGAWWSVNATELEKRIHYGGISRVDIYENNRAFVYDSDSREVAAFLFANAEDTRAFADALMSLRR